MTDSARGRPYYEQHFIVSDSAVAGRCDAKASLFTRVADRQILTWIQNVKNHAGSTGRIFDLKFFLISQF